MAGCIIMRNRCTMAHENPLEEHLYYNKASGRVFTVEFEVHGEGETITVKDEDGDDAMCEMLVWASTTLRHGRVIHWYMDVYE